MRVLDFLPRLARETTKESAATVACFPVRWMGVPAFPVTGSARGIDASPCASLECRPMRRMAKGTNMGALMGEAIELVSWQPELARAFHDINIAWIEAMFSVEDHDREVLENPQRFIVDRGGQVLFAQIGQLGIVGTCALIPTDDGAVELTKMGVLESVRGRGVGEFLLAAAIASALAMPQRPLFLLTNWRCASAIRLYQRSGFVHDAEIMARHGARYERSNVAMRFLGPREEARTHTNHPHSDTAVRLF